MSIDPARPRWPWLPALLLLALASPGWAAPYPGLEREFLGRAQVGAGGGDDLGLGDEDLFGDDDLGGDLGGDLDDLGGDLGDDDFGGDLDDLGTGVEGEISPGDRSLFQELSPGEPVQAGGATAEAPTGVLIGLRELASRALAGAGVVKRAEHGVRAARRAVEEADSAQWPTVRLMAEGRNSNHRDRIGRLLGSELSQNFQTPLAQLGHDSAFLAGVDVSAPLYRGGLWGAQEKMARSQGEVARLRQLQAVETTLLRLVDLYLDLLLAESSLGLETQREKQAALAQGEKLSRARDRFARDELALESELALRRIRARKARREGQRDLIRSRIRALVGDSLSESFRLERSFDVLPVGTRLEEVLDRARRGNLEVRVQLARAQVARERVVEAASDEMPEVNLDYRYRHAAPTYRDGIDSSYWRAALRLDVPLFDGGRTRARKRQARERRKGAELLVQETIARVEAEVRAAFLREARARAGLQQARDLVSLARRHSRAVQDRVDGGTLGPQAGVAAQTPLMEARLEAFRVQAEVIRARCRVHALTGELVLDKF